jgi:hypothetical protein
LVFYGFVIAHLHDEAKLLALLGPNFPRVKTNPADNTVLTTLLVHGLQSPHTDIRGKAIEVSPIHCLKWLRRSILEKLTRLNTL